MRRNHGARRCYTIRPAPRRQILTASRGQFGAHLVENGKRTFSQQGVSPTILASPILAQDTVFVFGYGAESVTPFSARLAKYDKNQDGQLSPDEYGADAVLVGLGKYAGNRDLIVTKEKWDAFQRRAGGISRLMALRLERDRDSIRARELWRYDKSFVGVIPCQFFTMAYCSWSRTEASSHPSTRKQARCSKLRACRER